MSQPANNKMIGAFVVSALVLAAAAVMIFGSGKMFEDTSRMVLHFREAVRGLNVGSPVLVGGVKVGTVTDVVVEYNPQTLKVDIPVFIELAAGRFEVTGEVPLNNLAQRREQMDRLIAQGLRAQLQTQSMVTGQLAVALDFFPGTPVNLVDPDGPEVEIPTIPSTTEQLADFIKNMPLNELVRNASEALEGLAKLANAPELKASVQELHQTLAKANQLMTLVNERTPPLAEELSGTVSDTRKLVNRVDDKVVVLSQRADKLMENVDDRVKPLMASLLRVADSASEALAQAQQAITEADSMLSGDSNFRHQIKKTLEELAEAAKAIRIWAEYLERHPEAMIRGKK